MDVDPFSPLFAAFIFDIVVEVENKRNRKFFFCCSLCFVLAFFFSFSYAVSSLKQFT